MRPMLRVVLTVAVVLLAGAHAAFAGRIVVANDEWQTSNTGFANTNAGSTAFTLNVASFFTGGGAGSFLVVSDNFSLDTDNATFFADIGHSMMLQPGWEGVARHIDGWLEATFAGY